MENADSSFSFQHVLKNKITKAIMVEKMLLTHDKKGFCGQY